MIGLALFTYKRPEHLRKVLESVEKNHFEKVYIFQDGLKDEKDREAWTEVSDIIQNAPLSDKEVHIYPENKGLVHSIIHGMNYVFERHETAIALEDDVVLAEGYKGLMEACFNKYEDNDKVTSICGGGIGTIVPEDYPYDIYFAYRMSSVAFGTWRKYWREYKRDPMMLKDILADPQKAEMLRLAGNDIIPMVNASIQGKINTWATYWQLCQTNAKSYQIIPVRGYAKDIGRDGTGTNSKGATKRYEIALDGIQKERYTLPDDIVLDSRIIEDTLDLRNSAGNKFQSYFIILSQWVELYQNKKNLMRYFKDYNISEVYIYGTGKIAQLLQREISNSLDIKGYIVEAKTKQEFCGREVYDMEDDLELDDIPIVITPAYDIRLITHLFRKKNIHNKVILIDEVLEYCIEEKYGEKNEL